MSPAPCRGHSAQPCFRMWPPCTMSLADCQVVSYSYNYNVNLDYHNIGHKLSQFVTRGTTPSGWALMAMALRYPKHLIIHFTDGSPNAGALPREMLPQIAEKCPTVQIVNLVYGGGAEIHYPETEKSRTVEIKGPKDFGDKLKEVLYRWAVSR